MFYVFINLDYSKYKLHNINIFTSNSTLASTSTYINNIYHLKKLPNFNAGSGVTSYASLIDRTMIAARGIDAFIYSPFFGYGFDRFEDALILKYIPTYTLSILSNTSFERFYIDRFRRNYVNNSHNILLDLIVCYGVFGIFFFFCLVYTGFSSIFFIISTKLKSLPSDLIWPACFFVVMIIYYFFQYFDPSPWLLVFPAFYLKKQISIYDR
jgi:O-antigen ligase